MIHMVTMNIALPVSLKRFAHERVAEDGYSSVSEYIRGLIREDQRRRVAQPTETLPHEGVDSGESIENTAESR